MDAGISSVAETVVADGDVEIVNEVIYAFPFLPKRNKRVVKYILGNFGIMNH